jgi:hypothetical protein
LLKLLQQGASHTLPNPLELSSILPSLSHPRI